MKTAFHGDLGDSHFTLLEQIAGRTDLNGVEIGDQRNSQLFGKEAAEIEFGDEELIGDLVDGADLSVIVVDILDDPADSLI